MTQLLVLFIDACCGLRISPLLIKLFAEFFSSRSWPNIRPGVFFFARYSSKVCLYFCKDSCSQRAVLAYSAGNFRIQNVHVKHRVSISIGLKDHSENDGDRFVFYRRPKKRRSRSFWRSGITCPSRFDLDPGYHKKRPALMRQASYQSIVL